MSQKKKREKSSDRRQPISSHLNIYVIEKCGKTIIRFALLPANMTDKTQHTALDVDFFRPRKVPLRKILENYKLKYQSATGMIKAHFPALLKQLVTYKELNEKGVLNSGFRVGSGLWIGIKF